jgi:uncharacterized protein (TIGR02246 family)
MGRIERCLQPAVAGHGIPWRLLWPMRWGSAAIAILVLAAGSVAWGQAVAAPPSPPAAREADERAIREAVTKYQQALERGDAKMLADLWTADGDIVDDQGQVTKGRENAAGALPTGDPAARPVVHVSETSLRFLTPDVAIEDGTVEVTPQGSSTPVKGRFTATWVRQDASWRIAGLRESRLATDAGTSRLADLEWMVGDWTVTDNAAAQGATAGPPIEVSVRWNATRTFLLRDMKIAKDGSPATHITQRIGWDPLARQVRSWMFSADGSLGEGVWTRDGDAWIARTISVLPDGSQMSALNIYVYDGRDRCTWRSFHTHVGGEHLPPVNMTMVRKPGSGGK